MPRVVAERMSILLRQGILIFRKTVAIVEFNLFVVSNINSVILKYYLGQSKLLIYLNCDQY